MADGGVWARLPQPNNGGGIWTKTSSGWVEIGGGGGSDGLEGLGGWATITAVTGTYDKHDYTDAQGTNWRAYKFTGNGTITTTEGLVEVLLCGGGGGENYVSGAVGGYIVNGIHTLTAAPHQVNIGAGGQYAAGPAGRTSVGPLVTGMASYGAGTAGTTGGTGTPYETTLTNSVIKVSGAGQNSNYGGAGRTNVAGQKGVAIIRVPAANAPSVAETFHGWDSFALVTDGVVTEVTKVPDNEPHTLDAEWLPCDSEVQAGWSHADGEFTPPPAPTRDDLIAELKERIKDLQKDTK